MCPPTNNLSKRPKINLNLLKIEFYRMTIMKKELRFKWCKEILSIYISKPFINIQFEGVDVLIYDFYFLSVYVQTPDGLSFLLFLNLDT